MIILALLLLLAIVCAYSWVAYRIKTTNPANETFRKIQSATGFDAKSVRKRYVALSLTGTPMVKVTVPASVKLTPFRMGDYLDTPEAVAEYARQEAEQSGKSG